MFDYSGYREVERDNQGFGTCDRFSELHLRLKLILFKRPLIVAGRRQEIKLLLLLVIHACHYLLKGVTTAINMN
ncbi:hypothetical protein [Nostoc sp. PA-18-2419]|uniref:hypothetical protein n=1 Tax=Nostoc sp. PA-18-2419 TaxID=2575443 RepID=UPI0011084581|nr:hypothetical protein [Nostoc sp. PA-18-2419]